MIDVCCTAWTTPLFLVAKCSISSSSLRQLDHGPPSKAGPSPAMPALAQHVRGSSGKAFCSFRVDHRLIAGHAESLVFFYFGSIGLHRRRLAKVAIVYAARFHARRPQRRVSRSRIRAIHANGRHRFSGPPHSIGLFRLLASRNSASTGSDCLTPAPSDCWPASCSVEPAVSGCLSVFTWPSMGETYFYGVATAVRCSGAIFSIPVHRSSLALRRYGRPEGSILCTLMIVIVGLISAACLRQVKYPDAAASRIPLPAIDETKGLTYRRDPVDQIVRGDSRRSAGPKCSVLCSMR